MKASQLLMPTLREAPAEAEAVSHMLMLRAGLVRKLASGIYAFLPLGLRVLRKIEAIIREEMDNAGAQELFMPALLPGDFYRDTGRWEVYGQEMFRLKDRSGRDFCLGPTHEEIFTMLAGSEIRSYRELPRILYQFQSKYRDELRPRFGVIRSREFIMKDAYSFDRDEAGLDVAYNKMYEAYVRIFRRCGLDCIAVDADSGAMGGTGSQEFIVKSRLGEAVIVLCEACGYAASDEKAVCEPQSCEIRDAAAVCTDGSPHPGGTPRLVETPGAATIEELTGFFGCSPCNFAKTLICKADGRKVAAMVRGDRELNEAKLKNHLGCGVLEMADAATVQQATGAEVGFAGPIGLDPQVRLIVDREVPLMPEMIVGANKTGYHYAGVVAGRDFMPAETADLRKVASSDPCPRCGNKTTITNGIETGHVFKLGTRYSGLLGCTFLDDKGEERPMVMGSYGIGVNRIMAAIIEQHHDGDGIIWPVTVAPFHAVITLVDPASGPQAEIAGRLYRELTEMGAEVLLDERDERAGVKFKDADLIGIPIRIIVGRKAPEDIVEFKERHLTDREELSVPAATARVRLILEESGILKS